MESRKLMLIVLGVLIIFYGLFTFFILFMTAAGMAETTVRNYGDIAIDLLSLFWPLLELILSWIWIALGKRYPESPYQRMGNKIALAAAVLPPLLLYVFAVNGIKDNSVQLLTMVGLPLIGHWTARILWLKPATTLLAD